MIRCDRCSAIIATSAGYGKNVTSEKVYCAICLDQMAKSPPTNGDLATFLAVKIKFGNPQRKKPQSE